MATQDIEAIAEVYARALFEAALGQDQADEVRAELEAIGGVLRQAPAWVTLLANPVIATPAKLAQIDRAFAGRVSRLTLNFLKLLTIKRRGGALRACVRHYGAIADQQAGRVRAAVTTAVDLDPGQRTRLSGRLADMVGREVVCRFEQDESILGGLVVTIGDRRMDASVRRRLEMLGERLSREMSDRLDTTTILQD